MAKRYRDSYAAAEDAFTSEGGHIADRMDAGPMRPGETLLERATLMATFAIRYNGTHYSCQGVRFLHLTDAVNHARLVLVREADRVRQRDATTHPGIDAPDEAERKTMSQLAISYRNGVYSFAGFDYHHLSDAVHFATLRHSSDVGEHPG